jgi:translation elongation factor EF-G
VRATVNNLTYFEDSTPVAFRTCAARLVCLMKLYLFNPSTWLISIFEIAIQQVKELLKTAACSVLQPIMLVEITVPEDHFGTVLTEISSVRKGGEDANGSLVQIFVLITD